MRSIGAITVALLTLGLSAPAFAQLSSVEITAFGRECRGFDLSKFEIIKELTDAATVSTLFLAIAEKDCSNSLLLSFKDSRKYYDAVVSNKTTWAPPFGWSRKFFTREEWDLYKKFARHLPRRED